MEEPPVWPSNLPLRDSVLSKRHGKFMDDLFSWNYEATHLSKIKTAAGSVPAIEEELEVTSPYSISMAVLCP